MAKKRIQLLIMLTAIFLVSFAYMNVNYDPLARNSSVNYTNRSLILKKLNKEELIYIVENNINVDEFYEFLNEPLFKLSNYRLYRMMMDTRPSSTKEVVTFVNAVASKINTDDLLLAVSSYDYPTLRKLIVDKSPYNHNASIVLTPDNITTYLDLKHTIGEYEPSDLVFLNTYENLANQSSSLKLRKEAAESLHELCKVISTSFSGLCGGFTIETAFLSYYDIQDFYLQSVQKDGAQVAFDTWGMPSHNEHQLGLAIDISISGIHQNDLMYQEEYSMLRNIAADYGFVFYSNNMNVPYKHLESDHHMRYIGKQNARECVDYGNCFYE